MNGGAALVVLVGSLLLASGCHRNSGHCSRHEEIVAKLKRASTVAEEYAVIEEIRFWKSDDGCRVSFWLMDGTGTVVGRREFEQQFAKNPQHQAQAAFLFEIDGRRILETKRFLGANALFDLMMPE